MNETDVQHVNYDSNEGKLNKILYNLKKPVIVIALSFILFNPMTSKLLSKFFPSVFINSSFTQANVRVLCLSLILGLLFLIINMVV